MLDSNYLKEKLLECFPENTNFYIGFSGGVDSSVLLDLCVNVSKQDSRFKFRSIHINHQLQKASDNWEQHCRQVCQKTNLILSLF